MAMDWLKGLVAPTAQFVQPGQPYNAGMPGAPPAGGAPPGAVPPPGGSPPLGGAAWNAAAPQAAYQQPPLPTYQQPPLPSYQQPPIPSYQQPAIGGPAPQASPGNDAPRIAALEARCDSLQRDLESVALFSRTLLTLLQDRQVVTQEQFVEAKNKLDMLDGKLDDRIAPGK